MKVERSGHPVLTLSSSEGVCLTPSLRFCLLQQIRKSIFKVNFYGHDVREQPIEALCSPKKALSENDTVSTKPANLQISHWSVFI